jgi:F-type H+-transporting ATPase subunit a
MRRISFILCFLSLSLFAGAASECGGGHGSHEFDAGATAIHHIADANVYSIGPLQIPLPCILYAPDKGWDVFMSSKFHAELIGHGDGHNAYNGYVLDGGQVKRIIDANFPQGEVAINGIVHNEVEIQGKKKDAAFVCYNGELYQTDVKSTADAGLFGGGITSFYDFSITKNVTSMALVLLFLSWLFFGVAKAMKRNEGQAPTGLQNFMEPFILFIRDEVAIPFLGEKY